MSFGNFRHFQSEWMNKNSCFWSPGLWTHDRTVLHVCSALPLSSKSFSTQELYRYHGNTFMFISMSSWTTQPNVAFCHILRESLNTLNTLVIFIQIQTSRLFFFSPRFGGWKKKRYFLYVAYFWPSVTMCIWAVKPLGEIPSWLLRAWPCDVTPSFVRGRKKEVGEGGLSENQCKDDLKCSE